MLLDIAIADSYAAGFEFAKPELLAIRPNDFSCFYPHALDSNPAGMYTDDTQMSLGLAEWMLAQDSPEALRQASPISFVEKFVTGFHRDPRQTYSKRMYNFLKNNPTANEFMANVQPFSTRSGAAMRSSMLGVQPELEDVLLIAKRQASVSHQTIEGISSAKAVALTSWFCHKGLPMADIPKALKEKVPQFTWDVLPSLPVSYEGVPCAQAAIYACLQPELWEDHIKMLKTIVSWGGDTDTVAAIAIGIRSIQGHLEWPQWALDHLENGPYGRDYLIGLDARIKARWN